jgi:hypothetical protein
MGIRFSAGCHGELRRHSITVTFPRASFSMDFERGTPAEHFNRGKRVGYEMMLFPFLHG